MQTAHPVIQPFLDFLQFEKRYSRHTIISYQTDLIAFFDYLVTQYGELSLASVSHIYIRSWLASLKDEGLTSKSINRKISTLKSFFKFQLKQGAIKQTPMAKIIAPKNEKRLPYFVSEKDIQLLFNHIEFEGWKGRTERMLLLLFYHTGMRLSELNQLTDNHINFSNNTVKVLGKGNKERIIPLSSDLLTEINIYIQAKAQEFTGLTLGSLLVNEKGRPLSPRSVYNIVKHYLSQVTTIEKKSPHVLRHTFATHLTNKGADLNAVKELLGHSSLAATQVYTHNTIEKLKNVYKKAHPKA